MGARKTIDTIWSNVFTKFGIGEEASRVELLKTMPLFKGLNNRELGNLAKIIYDRNYETGEYMFKTGQPGAAMFIIKEGIVQIVRTNTSGKQIELARLKSGEFLGELALLDSSPRSASAYILKETNALAIFRGDLEDFLSTYPETGIKIMRNLAIVIGIRLKTTNDLLINDEELHINNFEKHETRQS